MHTTQQQAATVNEVSQLNQLLEKLDSEVSTYYNLLNDISSVRQSVQSDPSIPQVVNTDNQKRIELYNPGTLYQLNSLVERLHELNEKAYQETSYLKQYI